MTPDLETEATVDWPAVARGALLGLALIIPVTILGAMLDRSLHNFEDSGWRVLPCHLATMTSWPR